MLLVHEASSRRWRHLQHSVLGNRNFPRFLDRSATEVGHQELKDRDVAHDEHRPRRHLDVHENRLQPLQDVHVALTTREALPERVAFPSGIELGLLLLGLALRRAVAAAINIQPSAGEGALVDGIQRGRLLVAVRHVADRLDRTRHSAGEHEGGLLLLSRCVPVPLGPLVDEGGQGTRKVLAGGAEMRQHTFALAEALRVYLA
mmetsp:Transcript_58868/g.167078  ORF Transcript_58868/g.167078 Transcript_58868/m.167078 type:complete len:203 (-) Transcript_58868:59-667(-)